MLGKTVQVQGMAVWEVVDRKLTMVACIVINILQAVHVDGGTGVGKDGAGAGHGGMGGCGPETDNGGMYYNLVVDPTEPGSNGIFVDAVAEISEETIGGGVLNFEVTGTTTIDGNTFKSYGCLIELPLSVI